MYFRKLCFQEGKVKGQLFRAALASNRVKKSLSLDDDELYAAVIGTSIFGVVAGDRVLFTIADCGQAKCFDTLADQILTDCIRTTLREVLVVGICTLSIGETSTLTITFSEVVNGFSLADLNTAKLASAVRTVKGTARSMGLDVVP